jgi:hypothetical protein
VYLTLHMNLYADNRLVAVALRIAERAGPTTS